MSINIERHLNGGVPHLHLDILRLLPLSDQEAGIGVSEVMKRDSSMQPFVIFGQ